MTNGKGKARAIDTVERDERTPLLAPSTSSHTSRNTLGVAVTLLPRRIYDDRDDSQRRQRSLLSQGLRWLSVFVVIGFFVFIIFLAVVWDTVKSAPASRQQPDAIVAHATRWRTISIDVLGVEDGDINISVSGELGIDTEWILGLDPEDESAMAYARRAAGRWMVQSLGGVRIISPTTLSVYDDNGVFLVNCTSTSFVANILPNNARTRAVSMKPIRIPLKIAPSTNTTHLLHFANVTWLETAASFRVRAAEVTLLAAKRPWWFPQILTTVHEVSTNVQIALPRVPEGYPQPGSPLDLNQILRAGSYAIEIEEKKDSSRIRFSALASVLLPFTGHTAGRIQFPMELPTFSFLISLISPASTSCEESTVPFFKLFTAPELNTSAPLVSIAFPITGLVLPIEPQTVPPLSAFVSNYLSARPSTIVIASLPDGSPNLRSDPSASYRPKFPFLLPPTHVLFPAPPVRPKILQSVTVHDMKLGASPSGEELTASGTLEASFVLPNELSGLAPKLDVRKIWPDALIFDGPPPFTGADSREEIQNPSLSRLSEECSIGFRSPRAPPPLPSPLPPRAFARIRPTDWLESHMLPDSNHTHDFVGDDAVTETKPRWVTAKIQDAPVEVLPGREAQFQAFLTKVLMSRGEGVLAGVRGMTSIGLRLDGLPLPKPFGEENGDGDIELNGLAFSGSFVIGRKHAFHI